MDWSGFEKLWALRGHAEVLVQAISLEGIADSKLKVLGETVVRMNELVIELKKIRELDQ